MTLGQAPDPVYTYRYHTNSVQSSRFVGKDQGNILSGSLNGSLCYWNNQTHKILSILSNAHKYGLVSVDRVGEELMLSHGRDGLIQLYNTEIGLSKVVQSIQAGGMSYTQCRGVHCVEPSLSTLITAASPTNGNIASWDLRAPSSMSMDFVMHLQEEGMILSSQLFSFSNDYLLSVSDAGNLIVHDCRKPSDYLCSHHVQDTSVTAFDYDPVTNKGLCGGGSSQLTPFSIQWSTSTINLSTPIQLPAEGISSLCIRPDHKIVASGGWDSKIRLYQWKNMKPLAILNNHDHQVTCVDFNRHNDLISSSQDTQVYLWNIYK